jgi:parvulin-like peptidyl-prolyl isomerase
MVANGLKSSGATDDGQEFYFAAEQHLGPVLFPIAKGLQAGQLSDPVAVGGTVHVLAMQANHVSPPQDFDRARDQVLAGYRSDKIARMRAGTDRFLRERADVQVAKALQ